MSKLPTPTEVVRCERCRTVLERPTFRRESRDGHCTGCGMITPKKDVSDPVADAFRKGWDV